MTLTITSLSAQEKPAPGGGATPPAAKPAPAAPAAPSFKISGLIFGDYYYFAGSNATSFDGQHGFWFRRIYLTYDQTLGSKFSTRFRLEANSNGKMTAPATSIAPFVKDASLKWVYSGQHQVTVGIQPTTTFDFVEAVWGLRHVEKTPVDLYRIDSARDFGVSVAGPITADNTLQYTAQFGNDSSINSEIDRYKSFRAALRYVTNPGLVAEGVFACQSRALAATRTIAQVFVGYQGPQGRAGVQYVHNSRQPASNTTNATVNVSVVSAFGMWFARPNKLTVFGRVDHSSANPDVNGIDYLPLYQKAPFTLGIAGVEYSIIPSVRVSPNVEFVRYGTPAAGAAAPKNDTVMRLTFYWSW